MIRVLLLSDSALYKTMPDSRTGLTTICERCNKQVSSKNAARHFASPSCVNAANKIQYALAQQARKRERDRLYQQRRRDTQRQLRHADVAVLQVHPDTDIQDGTNLQSENNMQNFHDDESEIQGEEVSTCPICIEPYRNPIRHVSCAHYFCQVCVDENLARSGMQSVPCPLCRVTMDFGSIRRRRTNSRSVHR